MQAQEPVDLNATAAHSTPEFLTPCRSLAGQVTPLHSWMFDALGVKASHLFLTSLHFLAKLHAVLAPDFVPMNISTSQA